MGVENNCSCSLAIEESVLMKGRVGCSCTTLAYFNELGLYDLGLTV